MRNTFSPSQVVEEAVLTTFFKHNLSDGKLTQTNQGVRMSEQTFHDIPVRQPSRVGGSNLRHI